MRALNKKAMQGFSLIELLIVITIIGILSAIGLSNYEAYGIKVRMAEAQRFALALTLEAEAYYNENDNQFPGVTAADRTTHLVSGNDAITKWWFFSNRTPATGPSNITIPRGGVVRVGVMLRSDIYPNAGNNKRLLYEGYADAFGNITWNCVYHQNAKLRPELEYLPPECQQQALVSI